MGINMLLDGAGKVLEVVPEAYDDVVKDVAKETGKALGLIPRTINAALLPLRIWIERQEYNLEETKKLLAIKLEHINPEKIVTPEPYIAIPVMQAISYCMDSEELRNLYANLLAKSMIKATKDDIHPSFVEIIKRMSPRDASNMEVISKSGISLPVAKFQVYSGGPGRPIYKNRYQEIFLTNPHYLDIPKQSISINVLINLGLIEINYDSPVMDNQMYNVFYDTPECKEVLLEAEKLDKMTIEEIEEHFKMDVPFKSNDSETDFDPWRAIIIKGHLIPTPFGKEFAKICLD